MDKEIKEKIATIFLLYFGVDMKYHKKLAIEMVKLLHSAHLKWNKEMREMIGGDEDIELDLDDPNGKEIQTLNIYRNQFRHQLLKQLEENK